MINDGHGKSHLNIINSYQLAAWRKQNSILIKNKNENQNIEDRFHQPKKIFQYNTSMYFGIEYPTNVLTKQLDL